VSYPSDATADPGDNLNFSIGLKNTGNNTDSYSITTSSASGWTVIEDPIISLISSQEGNISFSVEVPIDFTSLADTIDYTVFSNKNPDLNFSNSVIITIDEQQITTIMTVVNEPTTTFVYPGETFRIFIGVKNDGTTSDLYNISSSSLLGWTTENENDIFNPSGNEVDIYFDVVVPLHVDTLYDTVTYTISSLIDPSQTFTGQVELISTSDIIVGLTVVEPAVNKSAFPGDTVTFSVEVLNTGNSTDIYKMESISTKNWVTIDDDNILNSPDNIKEVFFKVVVPDELIDQFDVIDYTVSSKIDTSKFYSGTVVIKSSYNSIYALTEVTEPIDQFGKIETTARFSFKIRNEGNSDDIYGLKANSSEGWNTTVLDSIPNPVGEVLKVNFDIDIPANGEGVVDKIFYKIFSYKDITKFIEGYVNLTVSSSEAFVTLNRLTIPSNKSGSPGDTISFSFDVANDSNSTDKYHFTSQSQFNWEIINPSDFLIAPSDTQTVLFDVIIPTDAGDVEDHISFELSSLIDPSQSYSGNVILTCSKKPFVKMNVVKFPKDQAGAPGLTSKFTIEIQNSGNTEDIYGLTVSSALGWSAVIPLDSVRNNPGETEIFSFDILIPDTVLDIVDEITYKVFSYIDPGVFYEGIVNLSVLTTDVDGDSKDLLPDRFEVMQNYPNPFNPSTTIRFALPERSIVNIRIYNILGREVKDINLGNISAGYHQIDYDGSSNASGIYFYKISSDFGEISKKMILLK
ncbi:MAG: T9SS type A sorting domain-containing protein, partial [candidate division Zixibacteria bacterium]|nr:T9SS type A sorting domain-containing protein [candidate division Zixibacteria bacterium]